MAREASKEREKKIKHFAASLLRHFHQRNTNGYNTQTTPRFGWKQNEIALFFYFVRGDADMMLLKHAFFVVFNRHAL